MSGIDYQALRAAISMEQVLGLLEYQPSRRWREQLRGPCPVHDPLGTNDQGCFSVHLTRGIFRCFRCGAQGNQLDLWRLIHHLSLHAAAMNLCHHARLEPPKTSATGFKPQLNSRNSTPSSTRPAID